METTESDKLSGVSKSILNFTNDLYKIIAERAESYICSPLSAHLVLSMAAYGADKNTAEEMRKILHLSDIDSELLQDYQKFIDILNTKENFDHYNGDDDRLGDEKYMRTRYLEESILKLANKVYISENVEVKESYKNALNTYFRSKSESLDFSNPMKSAETINNWCSENTNSKISDIIGTDDIDGNISLILVNAVYFIGSWKHEFRMTKPKTFHLSKSKKIKVPTMFLSKDLYYRNLKNLDAQAVRLHFKRCEKYMEIIVPNKIDGLKNIEHNLNKISNEEFQEVEVHLRLPKFEVQSKIELTNHLKNMGIVEAFNQSLADFTKMSDNKLSIGKVLQKAFIKVDELGCEAAAVTGGGMINCSADLTKRKPIEMKVNRPFLFRIMDSRLKIPLFIGSVTNPSKTISQ